MIPNPDDTIVAVSTPPGEGGIGIVRLSGPEAVELTSRAFFSSTGRDILAPGKTRVYHGEIRDGDTVLDEVLVHIMRAPNSYTREDVVEINCHGGALPVESVLARMLRCGARLAEPGEFTRRAFLNGRIDLVQAEAVIDRIRAQTQAGLRAASTAARGRLSQEIGSLRDSMVDAKAFIEAAVDFPDDDLPELVTPELRANLETCAEKIRVLLATADAGLLLREGASVAIAGRPNVGKSSIFNALLRESRAIVSPEAGTTRDTLEERANIGGIPVRLTDTAGLREATGPVEQIGIERARTALTEAVAVMLVLDASEPLGPEDRTLEKEISGLNAPVLVVHNKSDLAPAESSDELSQDWPSVRVSALTGDGMERLDAKLRELLLCGRSLSPDQTMLNRAHQRDSLQRALEATDRLLANFDASPEFLSLDLEDAIRALEEITGETTPDDVLERIFSSFCIGK